MKEDKIDKLIDTVMPMFKEIKEHIEQCHEFQHCTHKALKLMKKSIMLEKELKK